MADGQKTILVETNPQGVATVTMARPDVFNAFDERMIEELDIAFTDLENDPSIRAVILAGAGKHFSAGADLNWMKRASQADFSWNLEDSRRFAGMLFRIYSLSKPTIAKVHGVALGGGVGLTCACDFAIAATNARFSVSEAKFGILPSVIGPYLLNAVGRRHA
ncbi:MAG: enoyl-CoA hydratase-related protein, partial [Arenicellales bacterium]